MKKIALFGAGKNGRMINEIITIKKMDFKVACYCDNNKDLQGKMIDSIEVVDITKLSELYQNDTIDFVYIAAGNVHLKAISEQLKMRGIKKVYISPWNYLSKSTDEMSENDIMQRIDVSKPRLSYFEFHVCDHCNLNCAGCNHFSNLYEEESFADYDSYKSDIYRLKELYWGVERIKLLGGANRC